MKRNGGYSDLRSYALLGDLRACALVAEDGAIDWLALPAMDSAPVCAALLDPVRGGSIALAPAVRYEVTRRYLPATMVLETTFTTAEGILQITDALTLGALGALPWTELARIVDVPEGEVPVAWEVRPGHCLAAAKSPWAHLAGETPMLLVGDYHLAVVCDGLGKPTVNSDRVRGRTLLTAGQRALLAVIGTEDEPVHVPSAQEIRTRVTWTTEAWRHWSGLITYHGRWEDLVRRSALLLKALTLKATGAIAGAATTSLPEQPGGKRNFDYRYAWIRDSSFALDAMSRLGLAEELHAGVSWLLDAVSHEAPSLRVFYSLSGQPVSSEMTEVDNVPGYRGSLPVNIGNSAAGQTQLGAYGHLLDAVEHYCAHGGVLSSSTSAMLAGIADHVCDIWRSPDSGLWELGSPEQYTSSKLGCWVALDRAVKLADAHQIVTAHAPRWRSERDAVRAWIEERCWSKRKASYTFYTGSDQLDAAVLLMARFGYSEPGDQRLSTTIDAIIAELGAADGLVYRYSGQQHQEGAFLACSCWLVEALVHAGRTHEAKRLFNQFVSHANDAGLLSEEIDPASGDLLGNIPQALTHLALINAATTLHAALEGTSSRGLASSTQTVQERDPAAV
jgi:GH15 family glucan-1,4-alpha-glucosidase